MLSSSIAILIALSVVTYAKDIPACTVSEWSGWGPCVSSEQADDTRASFSFPLPVTSESDRGRALMTSIMATKADTWRTKRECRDDNTCPEYNDHPAVMNAEVTCTNGLAGEYPCRNIDLLSHVTIESLGYTKDIHKDLKDKAPAGNDIWGWTDPMTKREYAIIGLTGGTSFVDVTEPTQPRVLAFLRSRTGPSIWRDMKVVYDTAYIVSEARDHGMQVFDLLRLRDMTELTEVQSDADYTLFGNAHNIVANEETGYVFVVGATDEKYPLSCNGGLHFINVRDRLNPAYAGCFPDDGYVHDAQCVIYSGPDVTYQGREICFCYNEDTLTLVDVTSKEKPILVSKVGYNHAMYTHQGWLTEDQTVILLDDELDEYEGVSPDPSRPGHTITYIWDVRNLARPLLREHYISSQVAIDHNQYIVGDLTYQSNYGAGLRILHIDQVDYRLREVAYFDVMPTAQSYAEFEGSWSNYPFLESGNVIVSSIEYGLYVVRPNMTAIQEALSARAPYSEQLRVRDIEFAKPHASCPALIQPRDCSQQESGNSNTSSLMEH